MYPEHIIKCKNTAQTNVEHDCGYGKTEVWQVGSNLCPLKIKKIGWIMKYNEKYAQSDYEWHYDKTYQNNHKQ